MRVLFVRRERRDPNGSFVCIIRSYLGLDNDRVLFVCREERDCNGSLICIICLFFALIIIMRVLFVCREGRELQWFVSMY